MGYDVSFHPVDLVVVNRVVDYVAGRGSIDDLILRLARSELIKQRAHEWVVALVDAGLGKGCEFETQPFFLSDLFGAEERAELIESYLRATLDTEVDALAQRSLATFHLDLPMLVHPFLPAERVSVESVEPSFCRRITENATGLRETFSAFKRGEPVEFDGAMVSAEMLLGRQLAFRVLQLTIGAVPHWLARGRVWPTQVLDLAGLSRARELFKPPECLNGSLGDFGVRLSSTIRENWMVGGYVAASEVPLLFELLKQHRERLCRVFGPLDRIDHSVDALLSAVEYAACRNLGFVEATDV